MKILRYFRLLGAALLALLCTSCDDGLAEPQPIPDGMMEVCVGASLTRTVLDDDGLTTSWVRRDRIAMWALSEAGTPVFANSLFTFWANKADGSGGFFRGVVPEMAVGTYNYYAAYPLPALVDGLRVSYDLPAVQDGAWHGEHDILLASATAPQLHDATRPGNDVNEIGLRFRHKVHALKITIPAGRNRFGRGVSRLRIRFPQPVAGRLTWDLTNPDAAPTMESASDAVTLEFPTPVGEGDSFWVFIAPTDLTGGEVLFTATDGEEYAWPLASDGFGACPAGNITNVTLTIPEVRPMSDYRLTVDPAQLGEAVTRIDAIEGPSDWAFPGLDLPARTEHVAANADGSFSVRIFADTGAAFPAEVGMTVASANTEGVEGRLGTGQCLTSGVTATGCTVRAPYLFFENFAEVPADNSSDEALILTPWGLPGWSGARSGVLAHTCIMANCHVASHSGITDSRSRGRVDTPCLPIRDGSSLSLTVSFDMGYDTRNGVGADNSWATCTFGRTDTPQAAAAVGVDAAFSQTLFSERAVTKFSDANDLPDKLTGQRVTGCGPTSRLSWQIHTEKRNGWLATTNVTYRCHIDNIRVTIAQ